MVITDTFTSFFAEDFNPNLNFADLVDYCYEVAHERKDFYTAVSFDNSNNEAVKEFVNYAVEKINEVHLKIGLSPEYKQEIFSVWGNVGYPNRTTMPHSHGDSFFSAVLYLTGGIGDGVGNLFLINPDKQKVPVMRPKHIAEYNKYTSDFWGIEPHPGKFIVFPSWQWHYVSTNESAVPRVSIAIDTKIVPK
jgi:uncharacterized protein (TIGR02466 family)